MCEGFLNCFSKYAGITAGALTIVMIFITFTGFCIEQHKERKFRDKRGSR